MGTLISKNILTQEERINVIKQLDSGKLCKLLADELGVGKTFTLKGADSAGIFLCLIFVIVYCLIIVQVNRLFFVTQLEKHSLKTYPVFVQL